MHLTMCVSVCVLAFVCTMMSAASCPFLLSFTFLLLPFPVYPFSIKRGPFDLILMSCILVWGFDMRGEMGCAGDTTVAVAAPSLVRR